MDEAEIGAADLQHYVRKIFGEHARLTGVTRVYGGISKKTYALSCESPRSRCILHIFVVPESGLTEISTPDDPVFFPYSAEAFAANHELLAANSVSVARIYLMDTSRATHNFDFAFVEYIDGSTMADAYDDVSAVPGPVLEKVHEQMLRMHAVTRKHPGSALTESAPAVSCEDVVLDHSLQDVDLASEYNSQIQGNRGRIKQVLNALRSQIEPRSAYHFIHRELGPEHVMIDRTSSVYFIDVDGATFFDLEYEHAFLQWRFDETYARFGRDDLDGVRMEFYLLAQLTGYNATTSEGAAKSTDDTEWGQSCRRVSASTTKKILEIAQT